MFKLPDIELAQIDITLSGLLCVLCAAYAKARYRRFCRTLNDYKEKSRPPGAPCFPFSPSRHE